MDTKTKIKCGLSQYRKPTPDNFRKLGDAIFASSTILSTYAVTEEIKWLAISSILLGAIGKFFTNFFAKE
jgi:hypothetical protein